MLCDYKADDKLHADCLDMRMNINSTICLLTRTSFLWFNSNVYVVASNNIRNSVKRSCDRDMWQRYVTALITAMYKQVRLFHKQLYAYIFRSDTRNSGCQQRGRRHSVQKLPRTGELHYIACNVMTSLTRCDANSKSSVNTVVISIGIL